MVGVRVDSLVVIYRYPSVVLPSSRVSSCIPFMLSHRISSSPSVFPNPLAFSLRPPFMICQQYDICRVYSRHLYRHTVVNPERS